ncbi:MAG TPA: FecR domain-containing protein [Syntrophorhabdaceae bacterium]|nr:FecR domain-containing protein [Syntrophorhabdaceae bacterium]
MLKFFKNMCSVRAFLSFIILLFIFIAFFHVLSVCALDEPFIEYRVAKRDALIKIADRILEDPKKWREVAKINRLKDPYIIQPEQMIVIPVRLLKGSPMDGAVTFIKGEALVQRVKDGEWVKLKLGHEIREGDTLKTEKNGSLEITFDDKSVLFMRPNTLINITTSQKKGVFAIINRINLQSGKTISNIKRATGTESRYEVATPSAIASARGTDFRVSIDEMLATRAEVLDGTVVVGALGSSVEVKGGEGTVVEKGAVPAKPVRLVDAPRLIQKQPIYKDIPLVFRFETTEGTKSIRATLTKDEDGKDIISEALIKPEEPFSITNLDDGSYYLIAFGIDALGLEGKKSDAIAIKYRANPLPPFIQIKDEDVEFVGRSAEFQWLTVKDAVGYRVQIATDKDFNRIVEEKRDYKDKTYKTNVLEYGVYYFRICSVAGDGYEGGWSNIVKFKLIPPPPSPPLEKPSVDKDSIFLKWRDLGEGIRYHFQMAKDEAFKEIIFDTKLDKSQITLKKPKDPGVYFVRTSSIDKKGREGNFSSPQSFEIERGFPYEVIGIIMGLGLLSILAF